MSGKITGQVWDLDLPHAEAWVLMSMADHAQHDGTHVFPSQALIAWKTGYSIRQVRRVQETLKHRKILIPQGQGYRGVQMYRLDFSQVPLKPPFITRDSMSSEDKMSVVKKPHVNTTLHSTTDKMSSVNRSTTDKMSSVTTTDKMSSEDISDTLSSSTTDISDTSHNNDARAESLDTLEPKEEPTPTPSKKGRGRSEGGYRLPEHWQPTEADLSWAHKKGYHTLLNLDDMTEQFHFYWHSRATENTKLDWSLTWKNRVMELAKQERDRRARYGQSSSPQRTIN